MPMRMRRRPREPETVLLSGRDLAKPASRARKEAETAKMTEKATAKGEIAMNAPEVSREARKPLLGPHDFLRLIRSCAHTVVRNAFGAPPMIPRASELERHSPGDLGLTRFIPAIHNLLGDLTDADQNSREATKPEASTRFSRYAENLHEAFLAKKDGSLVFYDKDALGAPRKTAHTAEMLLEEAGSASFLFSGRKRVLVAVPLLHSFGFVFGLLAPRLARLPAIDAEPAPDLRGYPLRKGDLLVLFPQLLMKLTLVPPADVSLLSSSSPPLDDALFKAAGNIGYLSLAEVYGTSLSGALGFRKGKGPYELFSHFDRLGEKSVKRKSTGGILTSHRLVWRRERHFGRRDSEPVG
ncbi:MAG: hypothetical protein LBF41_06440 [Deltaproteobacteria bacterium]|jgi:hypothetical protein|nr:hypothetical protein [Deltaproteobacteria bacterium]